MLVIPKTTTNSLRNYSRTTLQLFVEKKAVQLTRINITNLTSRSKSHILYKFLHT